MFKPNQIVLCIPDVTLPINSERKWKPIKGARYTINRMDNSGYVYLKEDSYQYSWSPARFELCNHRELNLPNWF